MFLKQFTPDASGVHAFSAELRALRDLDCGVSVPHLLAVDHDWLVLCTEAVDSTLAKAIDRDHSRTLATRGIDAIGETLRTLHLARSTSAPCPMADKPLALGLFESRDYDYTLTAAQRELIYFLRAEPVAEASCAIIRESWSSDSLIHGDLKAEHVGLDDQDGETIAILLDLETLGGGTPGWDYAGVLHSVFLATKLWSESRDDERNLFRRMLDESLLEIGAADLAACLGVRLWQTALESSVFEPDVSSEVVQVVRAGLGIASDPSSLQTI